MSTVRVPSCTMHPEARFKRATCNRDMAQQPVLAIVLAAAYCTDIVLWLPQAISHGLSSQSAVWIAKCARASIPAM